MKRWPVLVGLIVVLGASGTPARGCKFCCWSQPRTLRQDAADATVILYGTVANPRPGRDGRGNPTPEGVEGTTDLLIQRTLKTHPLVADQRLLELPRLVSIDPQKDNRYLILFDVHKGKLDPYRGFLAMPAVVDYLQGMQAIDPKDTRRILAHAFRHLEHPDAFIAEDAYREFTVADYREYRGMAQTLRPDLLAQWLRNPQVPAARKGTYAFLLGHCGSDRDAPLLRELIDETRKVQSSGFEQILEGYVLLRPREGWQQIHESLRDESRIFLERYAALRAIRFLWEERPGIVPRTELLQGMGLLLEQTDIADLAIEELRKWQRWDLAARILALEQRPAIWNTPIMRRSIIRFALSCPLPEADRFVQRLRKQDATRIEEIEELLRLEKEAAPRPAAPNS